MKIKLIEFQDDMWRHDKMARSSGSFWREAGTVNGHIWDDFCGPYYTAPCYVFYFSPKRTWPLIGRLFQSIRYKRDEALEDGFSYKLLRNGQRQYVFIKLFFCKNEAQ